MPINLETAICFADTGIFLISDFSLVLNFPECGSVVAALMVARRLRPARPPPRGPVGRGAGARRLGAIQPEATQRNQRLAARPEVHQGAAVGRALPVHGHRRLEPDLIPGAQGGRG